MWGTIVGYVKARALVLVMLAYGLYPRKPPKNAELVWRKGGLNYVWMEDEFTNRVAGWHLILVFTGQLQFSGFTYCKERVVRSKSELIPEKSPELRRCRALLLTDTMMLYFCLYEGRMLSSKSVMRSPVRWWHTSLSKRSKDISQDSETVTSEFSLAQVYIIQINFFPLWNCNYLEKVHSMSPYKYKWKISLKKNKNVLDSPWALVLDRRKKTGRESDLMPPIPHMVPGMNRHSAI